MSFDLLKTLLFFVTGGFLIFLAITIARDNFTNRLNRITGTMLFFSALGPIFIGIASVLDPAMISSPDWESQVLFKIHYLWEFFFPILLLFTWIFPVDRLKNFNFPRLRYLIFVPQIIHLIVVFFFLALVNFFDIFKYESTDQGFLSYILSPLSSVVSWIQIFLNFVYTYHYVIFSFMNLIYTILALYFLEAGRRVLDNPRLIIQTRVINWAFRIGLSIYIIIFLGGLFWPELITDMVQSLLLLAALVAGSTLIIIATIRYQFLDIRIFFRQTFVYSITSALLVGLYILLVLKSGTFLEPIFGARSDIINYIFIIFILLLFQPINNWIDEFTRSLFIRTRTDHRNVIERFSRQVISLFDPERLRTIIEETLKTTLLIEKVYIVFYDDKIEDYVIAQSDDNPKRFVIQRDDLMLRGINLLDIPTFYHSLDDFKEGSELAKKLNNLNVKLILPMKDSEHLLGFIALSQKAAGYTFSSEDLNLLGVLSNQMVSALTNARLYVDSLERIRLQEEVNMARQIQLDLLPAHPPKNDYLEISAHSTPSRTVGGDFFDFIIKQDGKIGVCIADASGKGMPAALMIAQTQAILKSEVNNGNPINKVLCNMNEQLHNSSSSEKYVTLFYGEIDTKEGTFHYSNAGHNYPILCKKNGECKNLDIGGPIVGALPMLTYNDEAVRLEKDDLLFFFTDGLSEAMDKDEVEYSEARIKEFIVKNRASDPQSIVDSILKDVRQYDPTYPPRDDTTVIAIKVNGFNSNHG